MDNRDDVIEYSLYNHHDENTGKKIRKTILKTTIILTIITVVEIFIGVKFSKGIMEHSNPAMWTWIKVGYICLTLVKAAYIVLVFMHLGDEKKSLKWVILGPYILFVLYLIFICLWESINVLWVRY
ncbi:MAG: cytochrome C oxidase subunit IV family protein [Flavobacteriales bacterium]